MLPGTLDQRIKFLKICKVKITNTYVYTAQEDGKYQLKIEVDDVLSFTSDCYEWKKPNDVSQVYVDNKEFPSIFGELRNLNFSKISE